MVTTPAFVSALPCPSGLPRTIAVDPLKAGVTIMVRIRTASSSSSLASKLAVLNPSVNQF